MPFPASFCADFAKQPKVRITAPLAISQDPSPRVPRRLVRHPFHPRRASRPPPARFAWHHDVDEGGDEKAYICCSRC